MAAEHSQSGLFAANYNKIRGKIKGKYGKYLKNTGGF